MGSPARPRARRIAFADEADAEFIRWAGNLLRTFIDEGSLHFVRQTDRPELFLAGVWRPHPFPTGVPVILLSNETWTAFPPHAPLARYHAVLGIYPPAQECNFVRYPYAAAHFHQDLAELYAQRQELLQVKKTGFCCLVTSNPQGDLGRRRLELAAEIDERYRVDSAGGLLNNVGYEAPRGAAFLRWIAQYRYMICLENQRVPGYLTEKPYQAWFSAAVPIYDGGCVSDLNPPAIIDAGGDVLAELARLEADPAAYEDKRQADLQPERLSLSAFEADFRERVLL